MSVPQKIVLNSSRVDGMFDEMPEQGDTIVWDGSECLITRINVVNKRKMCLKVEPKRGVRRYEDRSDFSLEWEKLPQRFLESENDSNFTQESLKKTE